MSTKSLTQGRRTPLSIGNSTVKQQNSKYQSSNKSNSSNANKMENKTVQSQKSEQTDDKKDQSSIVNKDLPKQQNNKNNAEKKNHNGVSKTNGSNGTKEKSLFENMNVRVCLEKTDIPQLKQQIEEKKVKEDKKETLVKKDKKDKVENELPKELKITDKLEEKIDTVKSVTTDIQPNVIAPVVEKTDTVTNINISEEIHNIAEEKNNISEEKLTENITPTKTEFLTPKKADETTEKQSPKAEKQFLTPKKIETLSNTEENVDDIIMEPLQLEPSPVKATSQAILSSSSSSNPTATSTPGKFLADIRSTAETTDVDPIMQSNYSPPRSFTQISGRRSIRPFNNFSNPNYHESYRRINTELDVSNSTVNTSLNVTVGSELPNSSTFSFFGRNRKRDRTPPHSQSAMEVQIEGELSPPKRPRIDMHGLFSVVSSPLSLLRSRFSKASIQNTPVKLSAKLNMEENTEVQNVSDSPIQEGIIKVDAEVIPTNDIKEEEKEVEEVLKNISDVATEENITAAENKDIVANEILEKSAEKNIVETITEENNTDNVKVNEIQLESDVGDIQIKNKRCIIM